MSKHDPGPRLSPKQESANLAWNKYRTAPGEDAAFRLRDAVQAEIAVSIENCVDEPARKDLHQGRPGVDEPIGSASIASLMELYGESGVSEDQWKALVLRLCRALMTGPMTALKRMTWEELEAWAASSKRRGVSASAQKWAASPAHISVAAAFDAGQQWAETDRCPDCGGRSHAKEECPVHEESQAPAREVFLRAAKAAQDIVVAERRYEEVCKARQHAGDAANAVKDAEIAAGRMLHEVLDAIRLEFSFPTPPGWELSTPAVELRTVHYVTPDSGFGGKTACGEDTLAGVLCHSNLAYITCPRCRAKLKEKMET